MLNATHHVVIMSITKVSPTQNRASEERYDCESDAAIRAEDRAEAPFTSFRMTESGARWGSTHRRLEAGTEVAEAVGHGGHEFPVGAGIKSQGEETDSQV